MNYDVSLWWKSRIELNGKHKGFGFPISISNLFGIQILLVNLIAVGISVKSIAVTIRITSEPTSHVKKIRYVGTAVVNKHT